MEEELKKRRKKFFNWLKKPSNIALILILLFALIIRIHYFTITIDQAVWWDEGEYCSMAMHYATGVPTSAAPYREIVIPYVWGILYEIYPGEFLWRFGQFLLSFATVVIMYLATKAIFDKKVALVATAIIASQMLLLFYTGRLLLYPWGAMLFMLGAYLFYEGHVNKKGSRWLYASAIVLAIGTAIYYATILAVAVIVIFLLLTEKLSFLKDKKILKAGVLGIVLLGIYAVFSYLSFGFLHPRLAQAGILAGRETKLYALLGHFPQFPHLFGWLWVILLILGMIISFKVLLILDLIVKKQGTKEHKAHLFALIWFWFVMFFFIYMTTFGGTSRYEGFIAPVFPAVAIIAGVGIVGIHKLLNKISKSFALVVVIFIVIAGVWIQTNYANGTINQSIPAFKELKPAGEWLKQYSEEDAIIGAISKPQINYYSERNTVNIGEMPNSIDGAKQFLQERNVDYIVLSPYDATPQWMLGFFSQHQDIFTPVHAIAAPNNPQQAIVIIYKVNLEQSLPVS